MDILFDVSQGSIVQPLLFNIFYDIILLQNNTGFVSYNDDHMQYCLGRSPEEVITKLEESSRTNFKWFENNGMEANPDKYHMLVSKNGSLVANIDKIEVSNIKTQKLLGTTFDNWLTFNNYVSNFCKTVIYPRYIPHLPHINNMAHAFASIASYIDQYKNTF